MLLLGATLPVVSCETLPRSGPDDGAIRTNAAATVAAPADAVGIRYALVDIAAPILPYLVDVGFGSLYTTFGEGRRGSPEILVGTGDILQVTIFESASGGLFIPADAGSRPGNYVALPQQTVDRAGYISIPYAGLVKAGGRKLSEIQREIESKLSNRAIEPQAVVALVSQRSNEASVVGEVTTPNKIALDQGGDRVLDLIAKAGGIRWPGYETFVTLQRGGRKETIFFDNLVTKPVENVYVTAGDTIYVYRQQRNFLAFGATGLSGQFKFEQEHLMLSDAVGKAGGLLDSRADPGQVFLYRRESRLTLEKMGVDLTRFTPEEKQIPVVYRTNFRDPSAFFASQKFPMRDGDIIYVSNSDSVELFKFLELVTNVSGASASVASDTLTVRNALRGRR